MYKTLSFILIIIILNSCEQKRNIQKTNNIKIIKNENAISPSTNYAKDFNNVEIMKTLSQRIKENGDTIAYNKLRYIYWYSGHVAEFLPYSMIMANDYNYTLAYFHCYKEINLISIENSKTDSLSKYYLLVAYEKNNSSAKHEVEKIFGRNIPSSEKYWNTLK